MYQTIVVGTDGSTTSLGAVRRAAELAQLAGATLHIVTAIRDSVDYAIAASVATAMPADLAQGMAAAADDALAKAAEVAGHVGVEAITHVENGEASEVLVHVAQHVGADLLVVGNRGMSGKARFILGSVPNRCAHHAPCSILIVHTT